MPSVGVKSTFLSSRTTPNSIPRTFLHSTYTIQIKIILLLTIQICKTLLKLQLLLQFFKISIITFTRSKSKTFIRSPLLHQYRVYQKEFNSLKNESKLKSMKYLVNSLV